MAVRSTDLIKMFNVEILNEVANVATASKVGRSGKYTHIAFGRTIKGSDGGAIIETVVLTIVKVGRCGH